MFSQLLLTCYLVFLMVDATDECGIANGCLQSSSLLQSLATVQQSFKESGTVQRSLVTADSFVSELAERVVGHNITLSVEETNSLAVIKTFIENLFVTAGTQHALDQTAVDNAKDLMAKCASDADALLKGDVAAYKLAMTIAKTDHSTCRDEQKTLNGTAKDTCADYMNYRKSNSNAEPPSCISSNHLAVGHVQTSDKDKLAEMESCLKATKPWLDALYKEYLECREAGIGLGDKNKICDTKQASFEGSYCEYTDKLDDACDVQDTCLSNSRANRLRVHASMKVEEEARIADYLAGKRVYCFLDVFEAANQDKNSTLLDCKANTYDTSHLNIVYAPEPDPTPCREGDKPPSPTAPTYFLVYRDQDDCSGQYSLNVTLDHESHSGCSNCWDRCAAGISGASSYRIVGPGQVAIAWNCIGSHSYASADFHHGGYARTQDSGCLKSQGGGAFALCHSASFTGAYAADHDNALSAVCSPAPPPPPPPPPSPPSQKPCLGNWVTREYEDQDWFTEAPAATCTPCVAPNSPCGGLDSRCLSADGSVGYSLKDDWHEGVCDDSTCKWRCTKAGVGFNSDYGPEYGLGKEITC